jgi:hypothetical protein
MSESVSFVVELAKTVDALKRWVRLRGLKYQAPYYRRKGDDTPFCQPCLEGQDGLPVHLSPPIANRGGVMRWCRVCKQRFWEKLPQSERRQPPRINRWVMGWKL